jgi:hypothetical protein
MVGFVIAILLREFISRGLLSAAVYRLGAQFFNPIPWSNVTSSVRWKIISRYTKLFADLPVGGPAAIS